MNDRERAQLTLIVTHKLGAARRGLEERIGAVFANHSARGRLHSGATIRVSVGAMGEIGQAFLDDLSSKTKAVAADPQAFVERQEMAAYGRYRSRELCLAYINTLIAGQPDADVAG